MAEEQNNQTFLNDDSLQVVDQQTRAESSQLMQPQRKKPGRKPNPASPALRKAQNRAAQRAFRERKERHLRDLEDTIKAQRDKQYDSDSKHQKETQQLRSMIELLESEKRYWKEVALTFECALNQTQGNNDWTSKIKTTFMSPGRPLLPAPISMTNGQSPTHLFGFLQQQQQPPPAPPPLHDSNHFTLRIHDHPSKVLNTTPESFLPSPTNSSAILSPLPTPSPLQIRPGSISPPAPAFDIKQAHDKSSCTNLENHTTPTINSSYLATDPYFNNLVMNNQLLPIYSQTENKNTDAIEQQLTDLAILVGAPDISGIQPKVRYPLSAEHIFYLQQPHDPRIDMIPCLHMRARMIQYRDLYDMYELCDLLIRTAKCHGDDPLDPDAWELPEEFFEKYKYLTFQQTRIKSTLYRLNPHMPINDMSDLLRKGASSVHYLVS